MATILYRIVNKLELTPDSSRFPIEFTDAAQISDYAKNAVTAMQKAGVINGYNNGYDSYRFNPKGQANRAEAFTMIYNFINAYSLNK
jgi:DNA-binding transcriptional regulator PaaX